MQSLGKRGPLWRNYSPQSRLQASLWALLIDDCGRHQPTVGGVIPGQVVLGAQRKQTGQISKQPSSSLCISSCFQAPASGLSHDGLWPRTLS